MACDAAALSKRTYRRWYKAKEIQIDKRATAIRPEPANKLKEYENQQIVDVCNEARFASLPPSQIVPTLLDEGVYIASEATFYRVLKQTNKAIIEVAADKAHSEVNLRLM